MNRPAPLNYRALLAAAALGSVSLTSLSQGALVVQRFEDVAPVLDPYVNHTPYIPGLTASSSDLIEGMLPSFQSHPNSAASPNYEESAGAAQWTNGSLATVYHQPGPLGNAADHANYGTVGNSSIVQYDLGATFALNYIDIFLGWNDGGRDDGNFSVYTSADGVTFDLLGSYASIPDSNQPADRPVTNQVRFIDDVEGTDGIIATGVRFVELRFGSVDNSHIGIVEIDIHGVPEPGTTLLGLLGGVLLLRRRRH